MTMYHYDERDKSGLPTLEVFFVAPADVDPICFPEYGWYYWFCLPGCIPDSAASGPWDSEAEALEHARLPLENEDVEPYSCGDC